MKNICFITGSRAEFGLLRGVMAGVKASKFLNLQVIATGMHLSTAHGLTIQEIKDSGFHVDAKVESLMSSDTTTGICKSLGLGVMGISEQLQRLKPDLIVILGDRYEILSAAIAALISKIPIAHIHGGEKTLGAYDDSIRHAITKMSHFHFVAADEYGSRVIQLGEDEKRVYVVGGLGVDSIKDTQIINKAEIEDILKIQFQKKSILITFHPVTLDEESGIVQLIELLSALESLENTTLIFTLPNADSGGLVFAETVKNFARNKSHVYVFSSLGQKLYLSMACCVDVVLGNSSSGILEMPTLKKPTINIGDRQDGRIKAKSIIDCKPDRVSIKEALDFLDTAEFRARLSVTTSPYGEGGAATKIITILEQIEWPIEIKKQFFDIDLKKFKSNV